MSDSLARLSAALADRYRVVRELGAGGMATVYLAHDLRHERDVAIKVLRPELAAVIGAERFLAEIKTTASLQHPHILPLHDSGTVDGTVYYVMPFVDGETLRSRLDRDKQLPIADAVRIACEVADALGAAHARGIIHRDVKPENILLQDGHALVADFGIALAAASGGGARLTETGMSLGTPTYMSPEQAIGERAVDARADIYALGAVTYEMLAGDPPFLGSTAQAIVAKVLTTEPESLTSLRKTIPPHVAATVHAALQKPPADRPASAGEFANGLQNPTVAMSALPARARSQRTRSAPLIAVSLVAAMALGVATWSLTRTPATSPVVRYELAPPSPARFSSAAPFAVAVSPDGERMAFAAHDSAGYHVLVRRRDEVEYQTVATSATSALEVGFSPDGRSVAIFKDAVNRLEVVRLDGSAPRVVADSGVEKEGLWWGADHWFYLDATTKGGTTGLVRISENGAKREYLSVVDTAKGEIDHVYPVLLPDARQVLFTTRSRKGETISLLDLKTRRVRSVTPGTNAHYVAPGWLVFTTPAGDLAAVRFDVKSGEPSGELIALRGIVPSMPGATDIALSETGSLLYLSGAPTTDVGGRPVWVGMEGGEKPFANAPASVYAARVSPDGRRVAFGSAPNQDRSVVYVQSLPSGTPVAIPVPEGRPFNPAWSSDGRFLYVNVWSGVIGKGGVPAAWKVDADGAMLPTRVPDGSRLGPVMAWRDRLFSAGRTPNGGAAAVRARAYARALQGQHSLQRRRVCTPLRRRRRRHGRMTSSDQPLLLDTVAFILWHADSPRLSPSARRAMLQAPQRAVYVSAATAFEIATKVRLGKLTVPPAMLHNFPYLVEVDGFRLLDVDAASAIRAGQLESVHRDPFDRLISAQALAIEGAVVTNDSAFASLGVPILW